MSTSQANDGVLTIETINQVVKLMRENAIPPCVVKTEEEAMRLTRDDPFGNVWKVGDEYYTAEQLRRTA